MIGAFWNVWCDQCKEPFGATMAQPWAGITERFESRQELTAKAVSCGWKVSRTEQKCPRCLPPGARR